MQTKAMVHVGLKGDEAMTTVQQFNGTVLAKYNAAILIKIDQQGAEALAAQKFRVRQIPERRTLKLAGFSLDTAQPSAISSPETAADMELPSGRSHHIALLSGPMHPDWKKTMTALGVIVVNAIDDDQYLVEIESSNIAKLQQCDFVDSLSPYLPAFKVNPALLTREVEETLASTAALSPVGSEIVPKTDQPKMVKGIPFGKQPESDPKEVGNIELVLFHSEDQLIVADVVKEAGGRVITAASDVLVIYTDEAKVPELAAIPQVREVNPHTQRVLTNNVASQITRVTTARNDFDLDGSGQIVCVADSGLDTGVDDATMHDDFQGRIVSIYALGRVGDASDLHNHGTHVSGSVLGDGSLSNGRVQGMAPGAQLVFQSTMDASRGLGGLPADLRSGLFDVARDDGARIHTNSWSSTESNGAYLAEAHQTDDFAFNNREFLILFAAGNDSPLRVNSPGSAKNALTVGASESDRPLPASVGFPSSPTFPTGATWNDFDEQADDENDVADFSCPGPVQNSRRKPDIVAPGTFILSTRSSVSTDDRGPDGIPGTGDEDGVFTHAEAVGLGLPGSPVWGSGDQNTPAAPAGSGPDVTDNYYFSNGTSMSTPITAGACALIRQYLVEHRGHTPSAALVKAMVINGARDMGMGVPDNGQGWGRLDLENILSPAGSGRIHFDDTLDNAVASGDIRTYEVFVSSSASPLNVTLVWRDPAGNTIQNRLHLRVINVDTGVISTSDDIANIRNNVQKVVIDSPAIGRYQIEVEGVSVGTAIPEFADLRQDYALVVANAIGFSCNPSDVVQVIDRSGSMGTSNYMEPAKDRAIQLIDILQINDQAGLVTFSSSAAPGDPLPLTSINSQDDKDYAHSLIGPVSAGGGTDLREALQDGLATLGPDTGRPRAMIMLSDGKHTVSSAAIDDPFLDSIAGANVKVYTIALGPDSDFGVLNTIASRTGTGSVYTVASGAELHKLHEIYYDIIGGIGCGGTVHLSSDEVGPEKGLKHSIVIDEVSSEALFAFSWEADGAEVKCRLIDPKGHEYNPGSGDIYLCRGKKHIYYRIGKPIGGVWEMLVDPISPNILQAVHVTTAVVADSEVTCRAWVDPKYLFHGLLLLRLKAQYGEKSVLDGNAKAEITYPTFTREELVRRYGSELKEIEVSKDDLKDDEANLDFIKLDLLAKKMAEKGKDIFGSKTISIQLNDDGNQEDPAKDDGIYTAFFNPAELKIADNFTVKVHFDAKGDGFGHRRCTRLLPVCIPSVDERLAIKRVFSYRNVLWRYTIIGAVVVTETGAPASPDTGTQVSMVVTQGRKKAALKKVPYYRRGKYYIWRFRESGFKPGEATVQVLAERFGKAVKAKKVIKV